MGGCIHDPGACKDMMEEHAKKGFSDRMDQQQEGAKGKPLRQPGWAELGVVAGVLLLLGILYILGLFG